MFADRSVVEIIAIVLTIVLAVVILGSGAAIAVIEVVHPKTDTSDGVDALGRVVSVILGALLGVLAGRADATTQLSRRPDHDDT